MSSVAVSTVDSVFEQAAELLTVCEVALATTSAGTPARTYVAPAEPPFDCCPFLSVHVPAMTEAPTASPPGGLAGADRGRTGSVILVTYMVLVVRCAPEFELERMPTPAEIEEVAQQVQQDGWAIWNELRRAIRCDEIFGLCSEVYFDGGTSVIEQGLCVGWRFTIRAALPGIPGECSS